MGAASVTIGKRDLCGVFEARALRPAPGPAHDAGKNGKAYSGDDAAQGVDIHGGSVAG
jgi:hypothetical protein